MMKKYAVMPGAVLCITAFLSGCMFNTGPMYTIHKLPSGKEIKVVGTGKMYFSNDEAAMSLKYITDLPMNDEAALKAEVMEIWDVFRPSVEKEGLKRALITAQAPSKGFIITVNTSRGYAFRKNPSGQWNME